MIALPRLVLAGALLLVVATDPANALTLCAKKSGRVVAAERCKRRDTVLTPADLGIVGLPGQMGATGPTGPSGQVPLRIVDGSGNDVGHVIDAGTEPACVIDRAPLPQPTLLVFRTLPIDTGIDVGFDDLIYYLQPDCAGQPHVGHTRPLLPSASVVGQALYYSTAASVTLLPQSFEAVEESCLTPTTRGTCCQPYTSVLMTSVAPAARFDVTDLGITFPITGVTP
ncbi:MAG TPA: hypothetical protein VMS22_25075 [Candidatus Eisenbacteria bacterium]|nr:hypothetical protein [Candidatus Eisenbacteria bacterium]